MLLHKDEFFLLSYDLSLFVEGVIDHIIRV